MDALTNEQKARLRELAGKATPGPWEHGLYIRGNYVSRADNGASVCDCFRSPQPGSDASFVATANPQTILALLDEIEALRVDADRPILDGIVYEIHRRADKEWADDGYDFTVTISADEYKSLCEEEARNDAARQKETP